MSTKRNEGMRDDEDRNICDLRDLYVELIINILQLKKGKKASRKNSHNNNIKVVNQHNTQTTTEASLKKKKK